ncbi:MAG TPA: clostripain-related cysteine peptidase, partial [Chroococcales cyanobacterium]
SHGHGPLGIADDFKSRSNIPLPDLQAAIQGGLAGKKLDVLTTKACLMATIEVGYQLSNNVRFLVASENGMTSQANQDSLLYRSLSKVDKDFSPRDFALFYAREGMALQSDARRTVSTLSVLDLEKTESIVTSMQDLTKDLLPLLPSRKTEVAQIFAGCRNWGKAQTQSDLYDLVDKLEKLGDQKLSSDCEGVKAAILPAVAFNLTDEKNRVGAHGLTVLTQLNSGDPAMDRAMIERYRNTAFDRKVGWSRVLEFTGISGPERKDNLG